MKTLIYICPTNTEHEGINIKVKGQCEVFSKTYNTILHSMTYRKTQSLINKFIQTIYFEIKSCLYLYKHTLFFIRYNPKTILLNTCIILLSKNKKITIEHNLKMDKELQLLKRPIERLIHKFTYFLLKKSYCQHLCVNNELKTYLHQQGFKKNKVIYIQNGYNTTKTIIKTIKNKQDIIMFTKKFKKTALFIGSGRSWHGCDQIINLIQPYKDLGLIIIGPYQNTTSPQHLFIDQITTNELEHIIDYCDFGISNFCWDMLDISEGSPLKSRQYLCNGLPILTYYHDCAADFDALKPYIFNQKTNKNAINDIQNQSFSKETIKKDAQYYLSWDYLFKELQLEF